MDWGQNHTSRIDRRMRLHFDIWGKFRWYSGRLKTAETVLVLLNLEPRKIRGIESQGMILMAENEEGKLSFLASEQDFGAGPTVR